MGYDEAFYKAINNATTLNVYNIMKNHSIPDTMYADLICTTECIKDINNIKRGDLLIVVAGERDAIRGSNALTIPRNTHSKLTAKENFLLSQTKMIPIQNLLNNQVEYKQFFRDLNSFELENRLQILNSKNNTLAERCTEAMRLRGYERIPDINGQITFRNMNDNGMGDTAGWTFQYDNWYEVRNSLIDVPLWEPQKITNQVNRLIQIHPKHIKQMLQKSSIKISPRLIKNIQKLNQQVGKFLDIKEIQQMQHNNPVPDTQKLVDSICKDMKQLEIVMQR